MHKSSQTFSILLHQELKIKRCDTTHELITDIFTKGMRIILLQHSQNHKQNVALQNMAHITINFRETRYQILSKW